MKSKFKMRFFAILLMSLLMCTSRAEATIDFGMMITQIPRTVGQTVNGVITEANRIIKTTLAIIKSVQDIFAGIFSKKGNKIPGTKEIVESRLVDIYDENSLSQGFKTTFLTYPSEDRQVQLLYLAKGTQFYQDTVIEAFTSVRELEKTKIELEAKVATAETDFLKGGDYNTVLFNNYQANITTYDLLSTIQELVAIKTQLATANFIREQVQPVYYGSPAK